METAEHRAFSHFTFCFSPRCVTPGTPTLPDLIIDHRSLYEEALDAADDAAKEGLIDVSRMEKLIEGLLAKQLAQVYELAAGKPVLSNEPSSYECG
jgi:hypothetical protein